MYKSITNQCPHIRKKKKIKVSPYESHAMQPQYSAFAPRQQHRISLLQRYHGKDQQRQQP